MASMAIKATKKGATSVPQPARARFLHGTYPPSPPPVQSPRIKPEPSQREYGKAPPLFGNPGTTGMS